MGIAEVIPGVSGGTIAFITGIYEELLDTIKGIGPKTVTAWKEGGFVGFWQAINAPFLLFLLPGMVLGIVTGVFGVTHLLEAYPPVIWAFFFGLILASVWYIGKQVEQWSIVSIVCLVAGAGVAYWTTILQPGEGEATWWYLILSGAIAICALLLPGISGSFILLLMGMYTVVIPAIKAFLSTFDPTYLVTIGFFAVGCLIGLFSFARVLSYLFNHYRSPTLALLCGFMLGALNRIWPWRNVELYLNKETGQQMVHSGSANSLPEDAKILIETQVLPNNYLGDPFTVAALIALVAGVIVILAMDRFNPDPLS